MGFEFLSNLLQNCLREVGHLKMSSFSITRKKTPFQKHREEEEAKKKVRDFGFQASGYCVLIS